MAKELKDTLKIIEDLYEIAAYTIHGVNPGPPGRRTAGWAAFSPSRFVYAYFVFNTIYAQCDWKESLESGSMQPPQSRRAAATKDQPKSGELGDIDRLLKYLKKDLTDQELHLRFHPALREQLQLASIAREGVAGQWSSNKICFVPSKPALAEAEALRGLVRDPDSYSRNNVKDVDVEKFKEAFNLVWESNQFQKRHLNDLHNLIYSVRCNVFHGNKRLVEMVDDEQQDRLLIYAAILLSTIRLFLDRMAKDLGLDPGADYNSSRRQLNMLDVPPGALFYPCCGSDWRGIDALFAHVCDQRYFVDPNLRFATRAGRHCVNVDARDWLATYDERLSVFVYRRDGNGEGGSGIQWLREPLLSQILGKLVDGGIIITDGSNGYCAKDEKENPPQQSMWRDLGHKPGETLPQDFEFNGWKFKCLENLERRGNGSQPRGSHLQRGYGPTYVWRVHSTS